MSIDDVTLSSPGRREYIRPAEARVKSQYREIVALFCNLFSCRSLCSPQRWHHYEHHRSTQHHHSAPTLYYWIFFAFATNRICRILNMQILQRQYTRAQQIFLPAILIVYVLRRTHLRTHRSQMDNFYDLNTNIMEWGRWCLERHESCNR